MDATKRDLLSKFYESMKVSCCLAQIDGELLLGMPEQENALLPAGFIQLCI